VQSGLTFLLLNCTIEVDTHLYAFIQVNAFIFHLRSCRQTVKLHLWTVTGNLLDSNR